MLTLNVPFKEPNPADYKTLPDFFQEEWCFLVEACKKEKGVIDEASVKKYGKKVWNEYWDKYQK